MLNVLPPFPSFDYETDKANAGVHWDKWVQRLENLFVAMNITDDNRKRALLLHYGGERVHDIFTAEKGDAGDEYKDAKKVLTDYFKPQKNVQMEIYNFRNTKQKEGQTLDEYVTELRQMSKSCEFTNCDNEIYTQIIQHCTSNRLRRRHSESLRKV